ncbi:MAG: hypothetical protein HF962_02405 [Sulfurovum sp.]|nr:hypothetical protein [Sulfurovum sp.]
MGEISFFENINMMVLSGIVVVVLLAFLLVVVVFTVKFRSQHEKIVQLKEMLEDKIGKTILVEESLSEVRILNASQLQELSQQDDIKCRLQKEIDTLTEQLQKANDKIEKSSSTIISLEKDKSELGANVQNTKEILLKAEEALEHTTKRNEFWVEQMTEVRTKYEALKLKVK